MSQLGNVMWKSFLIILLSNIKTSAQLMKIDYDPDKPFNLSKVRYHFKSVYSHQIIPTYAMCCHIPNIILDNIIHVQHVVKLHKFVKDR